MSELNRSYRQIARATSIFGGVQVISVLLGIIKSKFLAIFLGPGGLGIFSLFNSTLSIISGLTNLGLGTSAVRSIADANRTGDLNRISIVRTVIQRFVFFTGTLGLLVTLVFAPFLSKLVFGNQEYTISFIFVSVTLLMSQISIGQTVMLRGLRKTSSLAKSTIIGSILGLAFSLPVIYFMKLAGIVPSILITSFTLVITAYYFSKRIKFQEVRVSLKQTIKEGRGMIKMGIIVSITSLISLGASFICRVYISNTAGVDKVGLFSAGFAIINTYVSMIFTAMGTDFFPRLTEISNSNENSRNLINQQAEFAILIVAPIICAFLVFNNWVLVILYSSKFVSVNDMILWAGVGIFFKAASWPIGFIFLAKGDNKVYFISELIANLSLLAMNILGFKHLGFTGLGLAFMISYFIVFFQVLIIANRKYEFSFSKIFVKTFIVQLALILVCFISMVLLENQIKFLISIVALVASFAVSYFILDKRLGMRDWLIRYTKS